MIDGISFDQCLFENCAFSLTKRLAKRSTVRNCEFKECTVSGCDIGPAIVEQVSISDLSTNDLLIVWGAVFNKVKFSGNIGKLKINQAVHHVDRSRETQGQFDDFRVSFYASVDWALDIREARFKEFDVRGIPAAKFLRDPESQVVITRERAMRGEWRQGISRGNTLWPFMIKLFLADGDRDTVLVAPLGASRAKRAQLLAGLNELRSLGVAEPD